MVLKDFNSPRSIQCVPTCYFPKEHQYEATLLFGDLSCLIPLGVCCFRLLLTKKQTKKIKKKMHIEQLLGSQEAGSGMLSTHSHATHVAAGPQEVGGFSPAGQVSKSSQGLTTTSWLHLPRSPLRQVSMASTWGSSSADTFSELRLAQNAPHTHAWYIKMFTAYAFINTLSTCILHTQRLNRMRPFSTKAGAGRVEGGGDLIRKFTSRGFM